jgi:hypothetical protein
VVTYRPHHGRPADPQVTSNRRDRVGVLADPPAGLGPGALGQHRPRTDRGHPLSPGADPAGRLMTAPDALAPQEHDRSAADRQVAHPDGAAAVEPGPYPATHAPHHGGGGLDDELPLAAHHLRGENLEAAQAQQPGGRRTTVLTHLGPPALQTSGIRKLCEAPGAVWPPYGAVTGTSPRSMTKSRYRPGTRGTDSRPVQGQGHGWDREGQGT